MDITPGREYKLQGYPATPDSIVKVDSYGGGWVLYHYQDWPSYLFDLRAEQFPKVFAPHEDACRVISERQADHYLGRE